MHQVLFGQAPFEVGPRIHARRAVRLEEHQVAPVLALAQALAGAEEVVEAGLEQVRCAGIAGDVAAELAIGLVGAHHHGQRIPAHDGRHPFFDGQVAREDGLVLHRHAVHIGRVQIGLPANALAAGQQHQLLQHVARALGALGRHQRQKGVAPLGGFLGVGVG
ncbi:hypothetical protein, partial [Stenotrophomonas sp. YIM B06876]|uniref:hypothetical protein n=1 Tax=Stenotrophomonas sp. YIM B06876 TaxID=3060211 RepID=UPI0027391755